MTDWAIEAQGFRFEYPACGEDHVACDVRGAHIGVLAGDTSAAVSSACGQVFSDCVSSIGGLASPACDVSPGARVRAIGPLDWRVGVGEFQLLVGGTGSGKTTLLRNVKESLRPHGHRAGVMRVMGALLDDVHKDGAHRGAADQLVGFVSQSPENQLVCDSVWHEMAFGLENTGVSQAQMRRRVAEVSHFFGIEGWFNKATDELSGGQKQVVALASVLVMQPRVLVLDEPTAQLDPIAEKTFLHALFRVNRELGVTVVVSTHAPEAVAQYATSVVEMRAGLLTPARLADFSAKPLDIDLFSACREKVSDAPAAPAESAAPAASGAPWRPQTVLDMRDVRVRYNRDSDWVLSGCDFSLGKQEIRALIGGNGCGKTTLMRVAAGVLPVRRGVVRNALSRAQAYLPQNPKEIFVRDTVSEELAEWQRGAGYADADIARMAAAFALDGSLDLHPYDLSGGQQQLLALAKILLVRPSLLFLDEPTKGLDAAAKVLVARALLHARAAGASIVFATHDLAFALAVADSATMLFDGQEAATQPIGEFFENSMFYRPVNDAFAKLWAADAAAAETDGSDGEARVSGGFKGLAGLGESLERETSEKRGESTECNTRAGDSHGVSGAAR